MIDDDVRNVGEKPDLVDLVKKLSTQMGDRGKKLNNSRKGFA